MKDHKTIVLSAIMKRYGGLVPLRNAMNEDEDVVLTNLESDVSYALNEGEIRSTINTFFQTKS